MRNLSYAAVTRMNLVATQRRTRVLHGLIQAAINLASALYDHLLIAQVVSLSKPQLMKIFFLILVRVGAV
jgi:hypothetical protein